MKKKYQKKSDEELKETLTPLQYEITQHGATEPSFFNEYYANFHKGLYVDITSGQPLFLSNDKFDAGCGWPSFSKPIDWNDIQLIEDHSFGMNRVEVRSKCSNAHLGHVFKDGPIKLGGLRFCMNSGALRFIPLEELEKEGYGEYIKYFQ